MKRFYKLVVIRGDERFELNFSDYEKCLLISEDYRRNSDKVYIHRICDYGSYQSDRVVNSFIS